MRAGTACALSKPEWEHVVFDKIYNRQVTDKKRITAWMNWKVPRTCGVSGCSLRSLIAVGGATQLELGLDELELMADKIKGGSDAIQSFHHGSEDSTDQDKCAHMTTHDTTHTTLTP